MYKCTIRLEKNETYNTYISYQSRYTGSFDYTFRSRLLCNGKDVLVRSSQI